MFDVGNFNRGPKQTGKENRRRKREKFSKQVFPNMLLASFQKERKSFRNEGSMETEISKITFQLCICALISNNISNMFL